MKVPTTSLGASLSLSRLYFFLLRLIAKHPELTAELAA